MQKLPNDIQSLICASIIVNNYRRAIEELVYNAVDADSTSIAIRVNVEEQTIQVIDNGCGISKDDFKLLGQWYATSKCVDLATLKSAPNKYGFRGQALASIVEVSQIVKITSRCEHSRNTWVKTFRKGEENLCETVQRLSKGTTVEIKGFLYNLEIQRKSIEPLNELNNLKVFLEQLSLVHSNVSLSLRDDSKNEIIFQLHKNRDVYQTLSSIFGIEKKDLQELKVEKNEYKVIAYIGKRDKNLNTKHWIYLNGKLIEYCKIQKIVNENLIKTLKINFQNMTKVKSKKIYNQDDISKNDSKIPTYFIFIKCPYYDYYLSSATKPVVEFKNWEQVTKLMEKLVKLYAGDVKEFVPVKNLNLDHKKKVDANRERVKEIMEKILASNSKKIGVFGMQKGVKGKLIKRRPKKKIQLISLSKVLPNKKGNADSHIVGKAREKLSNANNDCIVIECNNVINQNNSKIQTNHKIPKKVPKKTSPVHKKAKNKIGGLTMKTKNKILKKNTQSHKKKQNQIKTVTERQEDNLKIKKKKKHKIKKQKLKNKGDVLLQRFKEDPTGSIKKRCDVLANKVEDLLSYRNKQKRKIFINEAVYCSSLVKNNKNYSIRKKVNEIVISDYIPQPRMINLDTTDPCVWDKEEIKPCKSTYDLIKTIIKTQETERNPCTADNMYYIAPADAPPNKDSDTPFNIMTGWTYQSNNLLRNEVPGNYSPEDVIEPYGLNPTRHYSIKSNPTPLSYVPVVTFDSHNGNMQYINRLSHEYNFSKNYIDDNRNKQFISRQFISTLSQENFVACTKKPKKHKSVGDLRKKTYPDKRNTTKTYINYNTPHALQDTSYSIEFSKSNNGDFLKDNHNESGHKNKMSDADRSQQNVSQCGFRTTERDNGNTFSADVGLTYTISRDVSPLVRNKPELCNTADANNNINDDIMILSSESTGPKERRTNSLVLISESQEQDQIFENKICSDIDPLNICETVHSNYTFEDTLDICGQDIDIALFNDEFEIDSFICDRNAYTQKKNNAVEADNIYYDNVGDVLDKEDRFELIGDSGNKKHILQETETICKNIGKDNAFYFKDRPRFVPKGMSQIFEICQTKAACDYKLEANYYEENIYNNFAEDVQINAEIYEPGVQNLKELNSNIIEKVNNRLNKENASLIFDGESLKQAKVLKQVDNKFIAAKVLSRTHQGAEKSEYLVLFDQHAVHERIRLELNLSSYFNGNQWQSTDLDDAITFKLSKDEILYLHNYKEKFEQFGLQWTISENEEVSIKSIPEAILGKNPRQVEIVIKAVKNLLSEEMSTIKSQSGCISLYPKAIMDLVFSEACRYAIKFGDKLTLDDCVDLIHILADCKTPFQCAHGRPVMAVLMKITSNSRNYKINLSHLKKWKALKKK